MSSQCEVNVIRVHSVRADATRGFLRYGTLAMPCGLGRGGRHNSKREGDGATPVGCWQLREIRYRPDRVRRPRTMLPCRVLREHDGWCDDVLDRNYNREVTHPYAASAEILWRKDYIYDVIAVLGYNDVPRIRGLGSAIFMHLARPGFTPSEGCITLQKDHLIRLLAMLRPGAYLRVF